MIALNLYISLGRTDILTVHEHGMSLHLFNSFQQCFVIFSNRVLEPVSLNLLQSVFY